MAVSFENDVIIKFGYFSAFYCFINAQSIIIGIINKNNSLGNTWAANRGSFPWLALLQAAHQWWPMRTESKKTPSVPSSCRGREKPQSHAVIPIAVEKRREVLPRQKRQRRGGFLRVEGDRTLGNRDDQIES
jgi:hypothetical protein